MRRIISRELFMLKINTQTLSPRHYKMKYSKRDSSFIHSLLRKYSINIFKFLLFFAGTNSLLLVKKHFQVNKEWIKNTPSELLAKSFILKGHTRCITALEFTPDGKYLFSASKDASIIRWDIFNADPKLKKVFLVRERTPDAHKDEVIRENKQFMLLILKSFPKVNNIFDLY